MGNARYSVVLGLKVLWFAHPCFPDTQKEPVPPPPGLQAFILPSLALQESYVGPLSPLLSTGVWDLL